MLIGKEIQRAFLKFFRNLSKLEGKSSSDMRKKLFYSINDNKYISHIKTFHFLKLIELRLIFFIKNI